ncbi:MAG: hypothetical protein K1Y02_08680 [Candidatus Hydrogenedentes bacterium]|nr:hypothetical protein [Candidatus Hydrogenedentota bacterium]
MNHAHNGNRTVLTRLFSKRHGPRRMDAPGGFLSQELFAAQLEVERARVDRSGHAFTVILFSVQGVVGEIEVKRAEQALIAALIERTRRCDTKGWYGSHPAVILPYTSKARAMNLTAPVEIIFRKHLTQAGMPLVPGPRLTFVAYGYPQDSLPADEATLAAHGDHPHTDASMR